MPRYLILASYNESGMQALASHPQDRIASARDLVAQHGGTLLSLDFALGEHDIVVFAEAPDDVTAAALSLAFQKPGHLRNVTTTRLLSSDEMMQAMHRASGTQYQGPRRG
ncbi:MAG TPA: GYD domain-containing protein [Thermomicrobiaceae bacterium]|nr:GYD domain-containing protein [Thermomicrobiaceae bacterium]